MKMKPIKEYTIHLYSKDGYCINCKSCSRVQNNSKREIDKHNNIKYNCDKCDKTYSRKDTFNRHKKVCK